MLKCAYFYNLIYLLFIHVSSLNKRNLAATALDTDLFGVQQTGQQPGRSKGLGGGRKGRLREHHIYNEKRVRELCR